MADSLITERQRYWRDHVLAAAASDGTIVEYAKANNLKTKDIYQWKTSLAKRGLLKGSSEKSDVDFVEVLAKPAGTAIEEKAPTCRLTLSCGSVLEIFSASRSGVMGKR